MAYIHQLASGNWQAQVRRKCKKTKKLYDPTGSFETEDEAITWAKGIEADIKRGIYHPTKNLEDKSLEAEIKDYLEKVTVRKAGAKQETVRMNMWLRHEWAKRPVDKIEPWEIIDYIAERRKTISVRGTPVSEQTIKHELNALSLVFNYAISKGMQFTNPVKQIGKHNRPGGSKELDIRIPPNLQPKLFKKLDEQTRNPMFMVIAELAIETAMREGEFFRLKKSDIKLREGYLIATDQINKNNVITLNRRTVPLSDRAKELLAFTKTIKNPDKLIFEGTSADGLSRAFTRACKAVKGLEKATFHSTRHEACTRLAPDFQIHILMKITGHRTTTQLMRYFNPRPEDIVATFKNRTKKT